MLNAIKNIKINTKRIVEVNLITKVQLLDPAQGWCYWNQVL